MGLSLTSTSLYRVVTTPFMVMSDFNRNNSQIYLKWILGEIVEIQFLWGRNKINLKNDLNQLIFMLCLSWFKVVLQVSYKFADKSEPLLNEVYQKKKIYISACIPPNLQLKQ
jgi:hypothetical protein